MIKFNSRQKQVQIDGVDLIIKPMKIGEGEEVRANPEKKEKKLQNYIVLCVFNLDGSPGFQNADEVDELEDPTFYEIWEEVKNVNCWNESKKKSLSTAESS